MCRVSMLDKSNPPCLPWLKMIGVSNRPTRQRHHAGNRLGHALGPTKALHVANSDDHGDHLVRCHGKQYRSTWTADSCATPRALLKTGCSRVQGTGNVVFRLLFNDAQPYFEPPTGAGCRNSVTRPDFGVELDALWSHSHWVSRHLNARHALLAHTRTAQQSALCTHTAVMS